MRSVDDIRRTIEKEFEIAKKTYFKGIEDLKNVARLSVQSEDGFYQGFDAEDREHIDQLHRLYTDYPPGWREKINAITPQELPPRESLELLAPLEPASETTTSMTSTDGATISVEDAIRAELDSIEPGIGFTLSNLTTRIKTKHPSLKKVHAQTFRHALEGQFFLNGGDVLVWDEATPTTRAVYRRRLLDKKGKKAK